MENRNPWTLEEKRNFEKAMLGYVDWAALTESLIGLTAEEVEARFRHLLHNLIKLLSYNKRKDIHLRKGFLWDYQPQSMRSKYQTMESGNSDLVRSKKKTQTQGFMEVLTDDLLQEIFIRLPNGVSVVQSTTVCKRWHSLVHKYPSFNNFVTRYIQHHASKEPYSEPTYISALFRFCTTFTPIMGVPVPFYGLSVSTARAKMYDLSFLPRPQDLKIRAACKDLILVSYDDCRYYICNSLTRNWFLLPDISDSFFEDLPELGWEEGDYAFTGYALVCHDPVSFSVVIVASSDMNEIGECQFHLVIFNSWTRTWTQTPISLQYQVHPRLFSCKKYTEDMQLVHTKQGIVHWLEGTRQKIYVVVSFDPLTFKSRLIPLPCESGVDVRNMNDSVRLGVVQGRLRLFLTKKINEFRFRVQIWELDYARWMLVHDVFFYIKDTASNDVFFVLCLDPFDGNVIYLVRGKRICAYEIGQTEDVDICEFPWDGKSIDELRELVATNLEVLTLIHPAWPTQTSLLASSIRQPQNSQ